MAEAGGEGAAEVKDVAETGADVEPTAAAKAQEGGEDTSEGAGEAGEAAGDVAAAGTKENPLPRLKKPMTAYFLFTNAQRIAMKAENPGLSIGQLAKMMSAKWRNMTDEEKKPFHEMHDKAVEEYKAELGRRQRLGLVSEGDSKKRARDNRGPMDSLFPISRLKALVKVDKANKNVSKDALILISRATEAFITSLTHEARSCAAPRVTVNYNDIAHAARSEPAFNFLKRDFPLRASDKAPSAAKSKLKPGKANKSITNFFSAASAPASPRREPTNLTPASPDRRKK